MALGFIPRPKGAQPVAALAASPQVVRSLARVVSSSVIQIIPILKRKKSPFTKIFSPATRKLARAREGAARYSENEWLVAKN
jgi:hypothetical protein